MTASTTLLHHRLDRQRLLSATDAATATDAVLGDLPVWRLEDLYPSKDSDTFRSDLSKAFDMAKAFEARWKGRLA